MDALEAFFNSQRQQQESFNNMLNVFQFLENKRRYEEGKAIDEKRYQTEQARLGRADAMNKAEFITKFGTFVSAMPPELRLQMQPEIMKYMKEAEISYDDFSDDNMTAQALAPIIGIQQVNEDGTSLIVPPNESHVKAGYKVWKEEFNSDPKMFVEAVVKANSGAVYMTPEVYQAANPTLALGLEQDPTKAATRTTGLGAAPKMREGADASGDFLNANDFTTTIQSILASRKIKAEQARGWKNALASVNEGGQVSSSLLMDVRRQQEVELASLRDLMRQTTDARQIESLTEQINNTVSAIGGIDAQLRAGQGAEYITLTGTDELKQLFNDMDKAEFAYVESVITRFKDSKMLPGERAKGMAYLQKILPEIGRMYNTDISKMYAIAKDTLAAGVNAINLPTPKNMTTEEVAFGSRIGGPTLELIQLKLPKGALPKLWQTGNPEEVFKGLPAAFQTDQVRRLLYEALGRKIRGSSPGEPDIKIKGMGPS